MNENNIRQLFRWITAMVIVGAPFAAVAQTHTLEVGTGQLRLEVASLMAHRTERMQYPYDYRAYMAKHRYMRRKCAEGGGIIVAARDFQAKAYFTNEIASPDDWIVGDTLLPYVVADATGWYTIDMDHTTVPVDGGARRYWRQRPTVKIVNDVDLSTSNQDQTLTDGQDFVGPPDMPTKQIGIAKVNTYIGISITERTYIVEEGEFAIVEFVFQNSGETGSYYDNGQEITYSDSVKGAYVGIKLRPVLANEEVVDNSDGWTEGTDDWVSYTDETEDGDKLRVLYGWDGDADDFYQAEDDEGDPYYFSSGVFTAPQYPGMAVLHADKSVNDHTDDPDQPHRFYASYGGTFSTNALTMGRQMSFEDIYQALDEGPDSPEPFDWTGWKNAGSPEDDSDFWHYGTPHATDENRYNQCGTLAFGPYDFGIDDSVRIVLCYAAGTINWESAIDVGAEYVEGKISKGQKNVILRSGRDSLFTKIKSVQELFSDRFVSNSGDLHLTLKQIGEQLGVPPAWPDSMIQNPVVGGCRIDWTAVDGAEAYRVYRRHQVDFDLAEPVYTAYSLVYQCGGMDPGGGVEYSPTIGSTVWVDRNVFPVYNYWYYVTAVGADGAESSHFIGRTWPKSTDMIYGSITPYDRDLGSLFQHSLTFARQQLENSVAEIVDTTRFARSTDSNGNWTTKSSGSWTSGFFPGCLWYMYKYTSDSTWKNWARAWTAGLWDEQYDTGTHDVGFKVFNSFGRGYLLAGDEQYNEVILRAAQSLATRYNSTVGCIRSWNNRTFPVIIDNMMNLELLFWASKNGGEPEWYDMAVSHGLRTIEDHVRADGSTYQIVDYNPTTGAIILKETGQGYTTESTWARGQSWGLYGFTMAYRYVGDVRFLETACKLADFVIDNLPEDYVPYWDYFAPNIPNEEKDASAAAIAASGLLELSGLVDSTELQAKYWNAAENILASLASDDYLSESTYCSGILLHGVGNHNKGSEVDVSLIYADYYFIEALLRHQGLINPALAIRELAGLVPAKIELLPNYPNPFNPVTTIPYRLGASANVAFSVYDLTGRRVRSFDAVYQKAGDHRFIFDARQLASGIYLFVMQAGPQAESIKMTLVR